MILFELFEGHPPFLDEYHDTESIAAAAALGYRPRFHHTPLALRRLIRRCWDPDPRMRPRFRDLALELEGIATALEEDLDRDLHAERQWYIACNFVVFIIMVILAWLSLLLSDLVVGEVGNSEAIHRRSYPIDEGRLATTKERDAQPAGLVGLLLGKMGEMFVSGSTICGHGTI